MTTKTETTKSIIAVDTERLARAILSGIAEPGEERVGYLVTHLDLGARSVVEWAKNPFQVPDVPDSKGWPQVHERLHLHYTQLNIDTELASLEALGGRIVIPTDEESPSSLDDLDNAAPFALWVLGTLPCWETQTVAIVGSRASTSYGNTIATDFAYDLAEAGISVISGGAYGIDAAAHRGALRASEFAGIDGSTVAVLCGGLDNLHPAGNSSLFKEILERDGAIITEMPPSFRPARWRFIERNRIIAALADATIVVEASTRSGAMATANRARDLRREIGAVPGPITSGTSAGPNRLIKERADLIESVDDIETMLDRAHKPQAL